jgi:integrase
VSSFTAAVLRDRLVELAAEDPDHLIFVSRTLLTTDNVRRRLRAVLSEAGIEGVTPHSFRRTALWPLADHEKSLAVRCGHDPSPICPPTDVSTWTRRAAALAPAVEPGPAH